MSWAGESLLVLLVALAGGFAWYERSHPSSKTLALVATLAALAALGRIAFAAVPDVKPTTDIVLIAGFALGGPPGFAVGAVAALTSNLFFTEGAWTPWQMFAWGLVGLAGAGLARLIPGPINRWVLAAAAAAMGILFGLIMNLFTWTQTGPFTLDGYVAIEARALSFDLAHAAGNVAFALLFGSALIRSLARLRSRLEITWEPARAAGVVMLVAAVGAGALAAPLARPSPAVASDAAVARTAAYLQRARNADGGFGARPGASSSPLYTAWAVLGLASTGRRIQGPVGAHSPASYLLSTVAEQQGLGDLERTVLALSALGADPRHAGRRDLVAEIQRHASRDGSFGHQANLTSFAVLALRSAGIGPSAGTLHRAAVWLGAQQNADGGFDFATRGGISGVDDTAGAVEALASAGRRSSPTVRRAVGFIAAQQGPDGGFPLNPGDGSNAQSTAFAIQAILAAGRRPDAVHRGASRSPLAYLRSLTAGDGSVRYSRTSAQTPVWVSGQALAALAGRPLPVEGVRARAAVAVLAPATAATAGRAPRHRTRPRTRPAASRQRARAVDARAGDLAHAAGVLVGLVLPVAAPTP